MNKPASRLIAGGLLLFGCLWAPLARAAVGSAYAVLGFRPYLDRGYNTRLGWQGWPVSAEDPHLYLYSRDNLRLLSEMEYLQEAGRIHTQIFKVYQPAGKLSSQEWQELEYFALEASHNRLGADQLRWLINNACQGEWRLQETYVTLIAEPAATWLRISERSGSNARPWTECRPNSRH